MHTCGAFLRGAKKRNCKKRINGVQIGKSEKGQKKRVPLTLFKIKGSLLTSKIYSSAKQISSLARVTLTDLPVAVLV